MKKIFILGILFLSLMGTAQPYLVGHTQITYNDPSRGGRSIQTEIYYPSATAGASVPVSTGTYPIIIFGHGFVMSWDAYQNIWDDLVPQGYIIAFPRTEGSISPSHAEFGKDLKFLVTKLQSESASNPSSIFYNHINAKSAIMGHSMGGGSSFLAAESNPGITALVAFAAANTTPPSIAAARNITIPSLIFAGENDCVAPPAIHQIPMYDSLASACKTLVSIKGGAHCEFANNNFNCSFGQSSCSPSPTITRAQQQDAVSDLLKLWLEYYLKDNCTSLNIFNDSLVASPRINYMQQCLINSPTITQSGMILTSTPASSYQWYWNGTLIPGANSQNYTAATGGNYYVEVTYFNACPYQSNTINLTFTDLMNISTSMHLLIYPNPASDNIVISFTAEKQEKFIVRILNVLSQVVSESYFDAAAGQKISVRNNISELERGLYLVEVSSETGKYIEKLIKQ